ncbi:MICOS complex subunit mic60 [Maublancomyces gigas]|uniref:MICOS complex subunit MIC60 n=1 Tax=Discina gigas TaxID=1032678 RepID=A0ABR3GNR0_9PEZI
MLRLSAAGPARAIASVVRYRYPVKQLQQQSSEVRTPGNLPGSRKPFAPAGTVVGPADTIIMSAGAAAAPPTPSNITLTSPIQVPLVPPSSSPKIQTSPPLAQVSKASPAAPTPPTPPTPSAPSSENSVPPPTGGKKTHRFRNFVITLTLLTGLSFAGGVFFSLKSDNFHDFFTEYIPFGEDVVLYVEEREFRRRFPKALSRIKNLMKPESSKVTIPRSSGATWKVFDPEDGKKAGGVGTAGGPHISAKQTEEQGKQIVKGTPAEAKVIDEKPAPKSDHVAKVEEAVEKTAKLATSAKAKDTVLITAVDLDSVSDPAVQDLVKVVNSIISLVNHSGVAESFDTVMKSAKSELLHLNNQIGAIKSSIERATEERLKYKDLEFATAAQGLLTKVNNEVVDMEHKLREEFEHEREVIIASYHERLRNELDRSHRVIEQRLRNELLEQAIEMKRKFIGEIEERVENERNGRLGRLQELSDSVDELSKLSTRWGEIIDANLKTQHIHVALEAVRAAYESPEQPKPFLRELAALKEVADDDEVVRAAIASINPHAYQVGVSTPSQLVDRFRRVAEEVRKAALLPEDAGVAGHAASWVLSKVLFRKQGLAQGDDVESILTRTETFLEEGDVDSAAREMNQLRGWARRLAGDWLKEARLLLEVQQAVEVIAAEARLQSLRVYAQH